MVKVLHHVSTFEDELILWSCNTDSISSARYFSGYRALNYRGIKPVKGMVFHYFSHPFAFDGDVPSPSNDRLNSCLGKEPLGCWSSRLNIIYRGRMWWSDCFDRRWQIGQLVEHQTRGIKRKGIGMRVGSKAGFESGFGVSL